MPTDERPGGRRILFLTPQLPYPPEQGTQIRNLHLIMQVARRHRVALLTFTQEGPLCSGPLAELCQPLVTVPAPTRRRRDRLHTLIATGAPDLAHRLSSTALARALRELLTSEPFDILQVEALEMAPYALLAREWMGSAAPRIILDAHNAEHLLQKRAFETDIRLPRRWPSALYSLFQWRRLIRYESAACRSSDAVLAVSDADALALQRLAPGIQPLIVPNGVNVEQFRPDLPDSLALQHPSVVFTGKMDFRPNIDAVIWFAEQVWPLVLRDLPQARFYAVGKNPHPRLDVLAGDPSITVTGYVADVLPYLGGADVMVAPLRIGGGTRLKILEALAAGLPLVSTTLGAEGVDLTPGVHALLADSPPAFAKAVVTLVRDREQAHALGEAGRRFVLEHFDWHTIVPLLEPLYAKL
ncbi:MAG: glycosyltransferase [Anaerolineae bacterium]